MSKEAKTNGAGSLGKRKRTLRQIQEHHSSTAGGAFGLRAGYMSDRLHRGSDIWLNVIGPKEKEWAEYLGATSFESLPIAQREHVRLWIADFLLVSYYIPAAELSTSVKEVTGRADDPRTAGHQAGRQGVRPPSRRRPDLRN